MMDQDEQNKQLKRENDRLKRSEEKHRNELLKTQLEYAHLNAMFDEMKQAKAILEKKVNNLSEKDIQLALKEQEIRHLTKASIVQFILHLVSLIAFGCGINYVTSNSQYFDPGIMLIAIGLIVECVAFSTIEKDVFSVIKRIQRKPRRAQVEINEPN